ncbi:molybdenum cofactor biosynthesis protein B [Alkalilimnicola ehrlichii MLHE-1]|uniref:Molybdenum cofactor biosynthesis protein B n=1 Tax=Alkalilimnicola ehrlichii (strain ATCC BAA-1101 / DSM 17681 / MLHE-1) TaxID=187272 RepID=Q0A558_ALKEH|nr:molybdenum cofactor biosynthesis protein B [Alkalilimnicola ehrlichii]ABI58029.1 molybdenum cofactor biosynthesis protein B [Alkalilimnicola ehrlichii MLHE-1]
MSQAEFQPLNIAVLTVSDTRDLDSDRSGQTLAERIKASGHRLAERLVVPDCRYRIRAELSRWIADEAVQAVITTGGTGVTGRDITPEAVRPLLDLEVEGFGEMFRWLSLQEIRTSTVQSRALGGIANATLIFVLPGSTGACRTAWDGILKDQLDARHKPCNFVTLMPRMRE